jgi:UDP:flavonoid glycosyltransferase YjiC (YdhE family)
MSRFLIVTLPLEGHAYRAVAVADALSARGHEVAWCGSNAYFGPLIGPETMLFPTGTRLLREQAGHGIAALKSLWQQYVIPMARFTLPAVDRAIGEYRPDVVVVDQHALAGALAADRHALPWATLITGAMELTHPLASWQPDVTMIDSSWTLMPSSISSIREIIVPSWPLVRPYCRTACRTRASLIAPARR